MLPQKSTYFEGIFLLLYFHSMNVIKEFSQQNIALCTLHSLFTFYEFLWVNLFQCCLPIIMLNSPS